MGSKYGLPARLLLSGITIVVLTCGSSVHPAAAEDPIRNPARKIEEPPPATYVLRAVGSWGEAQNIAVAGAGGTVVYLHAGSGVAVVRSTSESFLEAVLLTGRFDGGGPDVLMKWESS